MSTWIFYMLNMSVKRNFRMSPSQNALYFFHYCPSTAVFTEYPGIAGLLCDNAAVVGGAVQKDTVFYTCWLTNNSS